jgi:hypothetical protein
MRNAIHKNVVTYPYEGGGHTMEDPQQDDFYTEEEIEMLLEDDEISATEEAFMRGYIDA